MEAVVSQNDKKQSRKTRTSLNQFDLLWYFERMDRVNRAMQGSNDLKQVMKDVLDAILEVFGCDRAYLVYPCDPDSPTWQVPMERTRPEYPGVLPIGVELPLDPVGAEVYRILRNANGPVKFGAGEEHAVPKGIAEAFKVQSFIAMTLHPKVGMPWSFGLHQCSYMRIWKEHETRLLQEIGRRLSDGLSTLLVYRSLQERERHAQSLLLLSRNFEQAGTYSDVVNAAQAEVEKTIGFKNLWAYLFTADKKQARILFARGPLSDKVSSIEGIATIEIQGDRMMEEFVDSKDILVVEDAQTDERTNKELARRMGNRTLINIPILLFDRHMGSVGVGTFGDEGVRIPTQMEKEYLSSLASHMAVTLDRIHLLEKRRQMEEDLAAREREFRTLAEYSPDNIARYDINCQTIYVNPTMEKTLGRSASEMLGTFPKDAGFIKEAGEYQAKIVEVIRTGKEQEMDLVLPDIGEGLRYHNIRFVAERGTGGAITGIQAIGRDITERKRTEESLRISEQKFRTLTENTPNVVYQCRNDPRYTMLYVNKAVEDLTGYSRHEFLEKGLSFFDLYHPDDVQSIPKPDLTNTLGINRNPYHITYRIRHKNGEWRWVDEWGTGIMNEKQEVDYLEGIMIDITEQKRHELERESIINVSKALRKATTREEILSIILDQLLALFSADGSMIAMHEPEEKRILVEMGRGPVGERFTGLVIPQGRGVSGWVIENKKPYLNNRADQDELFFRPDLLDSSSCIASVPLIARDQAIGALWIARQAEIQEQDLRLLNAVADIAANAIHRVMLNEQMERQLHRLLALHQIDLAITGNFDGNVTLNVILRSVKDELGVDAASILLLNPVTHRLEYASGIGFRTPNIEQSRIKFGDGCAGRAAQEYCTISYPDLTKPPGVFSRAALLADEEFLSHYATPLVVKGKVMGVLEIFHRKAFESSADWTDYFETFATQAAIAIDNTSLLENLQRSNTELMIAYDATIEGWSHALDLRDQETEGHTQRVTRMVLELAERLGFSGTEMADIKRGALLHDIGKMGVPDSILHKPGPLTDSEMEIMQKHPFHAFQMLSLIPYLHNALDIPYCHHEKWDGSGYPRGLKGESIPLPARIFAVVDVFDALTSDRPYRKAWTSEKACQYIESQVGRHFDPQVVKVFLDHKFQE